MNPICLGGYSSKVFVENFSRFSNEFKEKLDGIELFFRKPADLLLFELNDDLKTYIQTLHFNSIHAPFADITYGNDRKTSKILAKLLKIYESVGAKHVVFHPNNVKDFDVLEKTSMNILLENMDCRKEEFQRYSEFTIILKKYNFGICLDIAHAISMGGRTLDKFLENPEEIRQVHASFLKELKHTPLYLADEKIINELKKVKKLNCPFVIENALTDEKSLIKEIDFLKNF